MELSKKIKLCAGFCTALLLTATELKAGPSGMLAGKTTDSGFAVLELFTSEGCSSCPPAETLVEQIQSQVADKPVYILEFHVDYWDRLGWKDPFSSHAYSNRQYNYSRHFDGQVYTPQLIINGTEQGIGSDADFVQKNLADAFRRASESSLQLEVRPQDGKLYIDYATSNDVTGVQLNIAFVQKHATSKVMRGENEGRTLSHVQIVRDLIALNLHNRKSGTREINIPQGFNAKDWEVIGLLQKDNAGAIIAANSATIITAGKSK